MDLGMRSYQLETVPVEIRRVPIWEDLRPTKKAIVILEIYLEDMYAPFSLVVIIPNPGHVWWQI